MPIKAIILFLLHIHFNISAIIDLSLPGCLRYSSINFIPKCIQCRQTFRLMNGECIKCNNECADSEQFQLGQFSQNSQVVGSFGNYNQRIQNSEFNYGDSLESQQYIATISPTKSEISESYNQQDDSDIEDDSIQYDQTADRNLQDSVESVNVIQLNESIVNSHNEQLNLTQADINETEQIIFSIQTNLSDLNNSEIQYNFFAQSFTENNSSNQEKQIVSANQTYKLHGSQTKIQLNTIELNSLPLKSNNQKQDIGFKLSSSQNTPIFITNQKYEPNKLIQFSNLQENLQPESSCEQWSLKNLEVCTKCKPGYLLVLDNFSNKQSTQCIQFNIPLLRQKQVHNKIVVADSNCKNYIALLQNDLERQKIVLGCKQCKQGFLLDQNLINCR